MTDTYFCHKTPCHAQKDGRGELSCYPCGEVNVRTSPQRAVKPQTVQTGNSALLSALSNKPSEIVAKFDELWCLLCKDLPEPVCEYKPFDDRKFSIDRAWPDIKVALEIEGFGHGMNNRYQTDLTKYNRISFEGWTLLRCNRRILFEDPDPFFVMVRECILRRTTI